MWISTRAGIDRYDGKNVKQYMLFDENGKQDLTGRINILKKDKSGNLWAYTNYGQVFEYNIKSDSYVLRLNLLDYLPEKEAPFLIDIQFADNERLLISGSFGIAIYHLTEKSLQYIKEYKNIYVSMLDQISDSTYMVSSDKGLCITSFDLNDYSLVEGFIIDIPIEERIRVVYHDKFDSSLLIGTASGKLVQYDLNTSQVRYLNFNFKTSIRDIKCYNNTLYIATDGAGLITINNDTKQLQETSANAVLNDLRVSSFVYYNILFDDDRLWIATYSDGVYLIDENLPDFKTVLHQPPFDYNARNSLNTVLEDSDGNMWFGTNNGVFRYQVRTKTWTHLIKRDIGNNVSRYNALTLCEDDLGYIWVGGSSFGLASRINKRTLEITHNYHFNDKPERLENKNINSIFKDSEGCIWLGGLHSQLTKYNPKTGIIKRYNVISVNTITESNNIIMVGTVRGLYLLNKNTDSFIELLTKEQTKSSMLSFINSIYEDKQGIIWLGTEGGLLKFNKNTSEHKVYSKSEGLRSNNVFGILPDMRNRLWLSSDLGLICFTPQNEEFIHFGIEEGLYDDRFLPRCALRKKNGELLFGTSLGAIAFLPEKVERIKVNSHLVLTNFSINYQSVFPDTKKSNLSKPIDETSSIKLKFKENTFSFGFTTINFTNPKQTEFEWQLTGYDKDWIKGTGIENAYYTNVPPGEYEFKLRTINVDDKSEIAQKNIKIIISPMIWATTVAKTIYILIIFVFIWIILQFIKERLEKRNTSDKMRFFIHTAHELKTPVSLIKGPLNKIQENEQLSKDGAVLLNLVVKNTDRLNQLVRQLLDFQKTEMSEVKLVVSELNLHAYIKARLDSFRELAKQKNINLSLAFNSDVIKVWFDEDNMDKIINNLLSNALKYTPHNGKVNVSISSDKSNWSLTVRDNGIGIPRNAQNEIFKPFYRAENAINSTETGSGIGLLLTRNLVKIHNGNIAYESVEGIGSVFTITFPLGKKHYNKKNTTFIEADKQELKVIQPQPRQQKLSIVIVEDNDELRLFLRQCLIHKYNIHEAINGIEGVKLSHVIFPELIISDVLMPEMDGYELCKQIKGNKETSHIPIILLTALDDKSNIHKGYEFGADNYVTKPFDPSLLMLTIENTISTRQALRRNLIIPLEGNTSDETELATHTLDKTFLDEVLSIIDKSITDSEFSINDLCREVAMSRTSFYNKMKILTKQSPNSFIRLVRLNRAAKLLKEGHDSVTEVASLTGFGDVKYFSTAFKKHFGTSPKKYMKRNK